MEFKNILFKFIVILKAFLLIRISKPSTMNKKEIDNDNMENGDAGNDQFDHQMQSQEGTSADTTGVILEQDRFLPFANISRIMKRVIPSEGKLSKEAKECVQECITEFLLFITSEASERCAVEKRKTISGEDILTAFRTLGFDEYLLPLEDFLRKYREANKLQTSQAASLIHGGTIGLEEQQDEEEEIVEELQTPAPNSSQPVIYLQEQQLVNPTNLQPVQVFYDAANGQYFIPVQQGEDGSAQQQQLWQIANEENTATTMEHKHFQKHC